MPDQALFEAAESGPNASKPLISRASWPPLKTPTALLLLLDMGDGYPHDRTRWDGPRLPAR